MFEAIFSLNMLWWLCIVIWFPACIFLIAIVLMQKGKGASFAGAFGVGGGSETVFGPRARKSLPVRLTYIIAGTFMFLSLALSLIVGRISHGVAPDLVKEEAAAANDKALDSFFGESKAAEAPGTETSATAPVQTDGSTPAQAPSTPPGPTDAPIEPAPAPATPGAP